MEQAYLEPFSRKTFDTRTILQVLYVKSCQSGRQSLSSKITSQTKKFSAIFCTAVLFLTGHAYLEPFSRKTFDNRTILHVLYVKSCQSGRQSLSSKITSQTKKFYALFCTAVKNSFLNGTRLPGTLSRKTFDTRIILHVLYVKSCQSGRQSLSSKITSQTKKISTLFCTAVKNSILNKTRLPGTLSRKTFDTMTILQVLYVKSCQSRRQSLSSKITSQTKKISALFCTAVKNSFLNGTRLPGTLFQKDFR